MVSGFRGCQVPKGPSNRALLIVGTWGILRVVGESRSGLGFRGLVFGVHKFGLRVSGLRVQGLRSCSLEFTVSGFRRLIVWNSEYGLGMFRM